MHESVGVALAITELNGHTVSIDGWYVHDQGQYHSVYFRFYVDGTREFAEWWHYPDGRILPKNYWASVFMGQ